MDFPSGDQDGIESLPPVVSCLTSLPFWTQMLPALAYTIEPGTLYSSTFGGTTTTFDGAGVASAGTSPLPSPLPLAVEPTNGTLLPSRLMVTNAMISRPTTDSAGASQR